MDTAIAAFAILSAFESKLIRVAELKEKEQTLRRQGIKGPHEVDKYDAEISDKYDAARKFSPYIKHKPFLLTFVFLIGIIFQVFGLLDMQIASIINFFFNLILN